MVRWVGGSDSSTGLAQIFAATAINAEKSFNSNSKLDSKNQDDIWGMWQKLQNENTNIYYVGLVLKMESKEIGVSDMTKSSNQQIENTFAGYNGSGQAAALYGNQTMQYYDLFKRYNSK